MARVLAAWLRPSLLFWRGLPFAPGRSAAPLAGSAAVVAAWWVARSVVGATLAGAVVYAAVFAVMT